tara:strand:+ start:926 stop:1117 length:192 start_codon:yes stop_codon:yes gene_type:complete
LSDNWWTLLKKRPKPNNPLEVRANYIPCEACQGLGCEGCGGRGKIRHPEYPYGPLPGDEGDRL